LRKRAKDVQKSVFLTQLFNMSITLKISTVAVNM